MASKPGSSRRGTSRRDGRETLVEAAGPGLAAFLAEQRWFGGKGRAIAAVTPLDSAGLPGSSGVLALFRVDYADGAPDTYFIPLRPAGGQPTGLPQDATGDPAFCPALVEQMRAGGALSGQRGTFRFRPTAALAEILPEPAPEAVRSRAEQTNTSVVLGDRAILKLFRRLEAGTSPELEIADFLTGATAFRASPRLGGSLTYEGPKGEPITLGLLHEFITNQGDAWTAIQSRLDEYLGSALDSGGEGRSADAFSRALVAADATEARALGALAGQLHGALASAPASSPLGPEPITGADARRWHETMREDLARALRALQAALDALPADVRERARQVVALEPRLLERLPSLDALARDGVLKIRIHGDFHLGQVLRVAGGFAILDFEGEPARPLAERRARQCALKDVAGLLRSFSYAAQAARLRALEVGGDRAAPPDRVASRVDAWEQAVRGAFLEGYLAETLERGALFLPRQRESVEALLRVFELDKAIYELQYELDHRPGWVSIPLEALSRLGTPVAVVEPVAPRVEAGPFRFVACLELHEFVGARAEDERQLGDLIEQVPLDSIYYHTHAFFLRHKFIAGSYPNDFATWVAVRLHDQPLGERLAMVDPSRVPNLDALRDELASVIDEHLRRFPGFPHMAAAEPFDFVRSRVVEIPTGVEVRTLEEFRQALLDVDASAIYFHLVEARMRLGRGQNDFAAWLGKVLGLSRLAAAVRTLNPYAGSLERTRSRLLQLCDEALAEGPGR